MESMEHLPHYAVIQVEKRLQITEAAGAPTVCNKEHWSVLREMNQPQGTITTSSSPAKQKNMVTSVSVFFSWCVRVLNRSNRN